MTGYLTKPKRPSKGYIAYGFVGKDGKAIPCPPDPTDYKRQRESRERFRAFQKKEAELDRKIWWWIIGFIIFLSACTGIQAGKRSRAHKSETQIEYENSRGEQDAVRNDIPYRVP